MFPSSKMEERVRRATVSIMMLMMMMMMMMMMSRGVTQTERLGRIGRVLKSHFSSMDTQEMEKHTMCVGLIVTRVAYPTWSMGTFPCPSSLIQERCRHHRR